MFEKHRNLLAKNLEFIFLSGQFLFHYSSFLDMSMHMFIGFVHVHSLKEVDSTSLHSLHQRGLNIFLSRTSLPSNLPWRTMEAPLQHIYSQNLLLESTEKLAQPIAQSQNYFKRLANISRFILFSIKSSYQIRSITKNAK